MILSYKNVSIMHDDFTILQDVNLQINEGEFVLLMGRVGSGKSSLLKSIYAEMDIARGEAMVLGRDLTKIRRSQIPALRRELGIVFQDFRLLPDRNVVRNLDFVLRATGWRHADARQRRIREVLDIVSMTEKALAMPYELSGGEKQRVCIARALLNSPKLILADEATGQQDTAATLRTTQLLHSLTKTGTAVLMATHNDTLSRQFPATIYRCAEKTMTRLDPSACREMPDTDDDDSVPEAIIATDAD